MYYIYDKNEIYIAKTDSYYWAKKIARHEYGYILLDEEIVFESIEYYSLWSNDWGYYDNGEI